MKSFQQRRFGSFGRSRADCIDQSLRQKDRPGEETAKHGRGVIPPSALMFINDAGVSLHIFSQDEVAEVSALSDGYFGDEPGKADRTYNQRTLDRLVCANRFDQISSQQVISDQN